MNLREKFKLPSSESISQLDVHIATDKDTGSVYIIDKYYNSYDEFIDRMYDMCKALGITLIGHDPHDGLMTTFHFHDLADVYAFDIILNGNSHDPEPSYIYPTNSSIPLDYLEQSVKEYCHHHDIRIADIAKIEDENCISIITDRTVAMAAILQAHKHRIFEMMAIEKMEENQIEHIFTIELPRYIVDIKEFQQNFESICKNNNITANFEMNTPYFRCLRITTNSTENMMTLNQLHARGAFNVGLHDKVIYIQPAFGA